LFRNASAVWIPKAKVLATISNITIHQWYQPNQGYNDIALVKISDASNLKGFKIACLPPLLKTGIDPPLESQNFYGVEWKFREIGKI